jgi:hypothetical protein
MINNMINIFNKIFAFLKIETSCKFYNIFKKMKKKELNSNSNRENNRKKIY